MNNILIIVFVFVFFIFCTSIYLLIHPELFSERKKISRVQIKDVPLILSGSVNDHFNASIHRQICLKWPDIRVMMKMEMLDDAIVYHWQGLHQNHGAFLFIIDDDNCLESMMNGLMACIDENRIPGSDLWFVIPVECSLTRAAASAVDYMKSQHVTADAVIRRGMGMKTDQEGNYCGYIGAYDKPFYQIIIQGDTEEYDFVSDLDETKLFEPQVPENFMQYYQWIKEDVPSEITKSYQKIWLDEDTLISCLSSWNPDLKWLFYPHIVKTEEGIALYGNDMQTLNEAYATLQEHAKKNNVTLHLRGLYPGKQSWNEELYQTFSLAYQTTCQCEQTVVVPYECAVDDVVVCEAPLITISPMFLLQKTNSTMENHFYQFIFSEIGKKKEIVR